MKKINFIFLFAISNIFTTSEKISIAETVAISGLISVIYDFFGFKLDLSSLKRKIDKGCPCSEEFGKWQKDTALGCLSLPLATNYFEEILNSLLKIKDEVLRKKLTNIFKRNLRLFSKCLDVCPDLYSYVKNKIKNAPTNKALSVSAFFNFLNAFLNFKANNKIDEYALKKDMKFINRSVLKSSYFLLKHFLINKAFDYAIVFSLFLASNDFEEVNKNIEDIENLNKNMYNASDLFLIGADALKSFK